MRKQLIIFLTLIMTIANSTYAKFNPGDYFNENFYRDTLDIAEFDIIFKTAEAKNDFKKLRVFLYEKEALLESLRLIQNKYSGDSVDISIYKERIEELETIKTYSGKKRKENGWRVPDSIMVPYHYLFVDNIKMGGNVGDTLVHKHKLTELLQIYNQKLIAKRSRYSMNDNINTSIANVKSDIEKCLTQLDLTLSPEIRAQDFKKQISFIFALLIGILLFIFFLLIYLKSEMGFARELLSEYGLQFITIFVLIIAVVLFGILDIIKGSELAAMLSGIAGYILGKGKGTTVTTTKDVGTQPPPTSGNNDKKDADDGTPPPPDNAPRTESTVIRTG